MRDFWYEFKDLFLVVLGMILFLPSLCVLILLWEWAKEQWEDRARAQEQRDRAARALLEPLIPPPPPPTRAAAAGWLDDLADEQAKKRAEQARRMAHYHATSEYFHPVVERLLSDLAKAYWGAETGWRVRSSPRSGYWHAEKDCYEFTVHLSLSSNSPKFEVWASGNTIRDIDTSELALRLALREAGQRGPRKTGE